MAAEVAQRRDDQLAITFLLTLFMLFQACMSVTEYSGFFACFCGHLNAFIVRLTETTNVRGF
jgi:hypothetical protein